MMFLSSYGFRSPIISEKFKETIPTPSSKTIVVVPYAGENKNMTVLLETEGIENFGFGSDNIYIIDNYNDNLVPDYIYVPGGDPFKLLSSLQNENYIEKIKEWVNKGSIYIGVSAGAYVATENIEYVKQLESNEVNTSSYDALGLVKASFICHYDQYGLPYYHAVKRVSDVPIYTIKNDEILVL